LSGSRLPAVPPSGPGGLPCHECAALCCRYYALQIDTPESEEDFEAIRWYLMHGSTWVWVDEGDWYLQVEQECRNLGPSGECLVYETRPQICRDYGLPEAGEEAEEAPCDYFAEDASHDLEFRSPGELERYARLVLRGRDLERRRRSEAARRGWRTRRAHRPAGGPR
jgi:Fe-S-cluster containining protein